MLDQLTEIADIFAILLGVASAIILLVGSIVALVKFVRGMLFERHRPGEDVSDHHVNPIRVEFGRYITLGLEFLIAKDILETLFEPQWDDIGQLAALVAIRTVVGVFLMFEIERIEHKK